MKKTIVITVVIDDVEFNKIEMISQALEDLLSEFETKRIDVNLSDTPRLRPNRK